MRIDLQFTRNSGDEKTIRPLVNFVAKHFSVAGRFKIIVWKPHCGVNWRERSVGVSSIDPSAEFTDPIKKDKTHYRGFEYDIDPYEIRNPTEAFIHRLAFGIAAATIRRAKRQSRIRVLAKNKATQVLEEFRKPGTTATMEQEAQQAREEEDMKWAVAQRKIMEKNSPKGKIATLTGRLKRWKSKKRRAETAIKKIERRIRSLENKLDTSQ